MEDGWPGDLPALLTGLLLRRTPSMTLAIGSLAPFKIFIPAASEGFFWADFSIAAVIPSPPSPLDEGAQLLAIVRSFKLSISKEEIPKFRIVTGCSDANCKSRLAASVGSFKDTRTPLNLSTFAALREIGGELKPQKCI